MHLNEKRIQTPEAINSSWHGDKSESTTLTQRKGEIAWMTLTVNVDRPLA